MTNGMKFGKPIPPTTEEVKNVVDSETANKTSSAPTDIKPPEDLPQTGDAKFSPAPSNDSAPAVEKGTRVIPAEEESDRIIFTNEHSPNISFGPRFQFVNGVMTLKPEDAEEFVSLLGRQPVGISCHVRKTPSRAEAEELIRKNVLKTGGKHTQGMDSTANTIQANM